MTSAIGRFFDERKPSIKDHDNFLIWSIKIDNRNTPQINVKIAIKYFMPEYESYIYFEWFTNHSVVQVLHIWHKKTEKQDAAIKLIIGLCLGLNEVNHINNPKAAVIHNGDVYKILI